MYICKFGQNSSSGPEGDPRKRIYVDVDFTDVVDVIRTKHNMSPTLQAGGLKYIMKGEGGIVKPVPKITINFDKPCDKTSDLKEQIFVDSFSCSPLNFLF